MAQKADYITDRAYSDKGEGVQNLQNDANVINGSRWIGIRHPLSGRPDNGELLLQIVSNVSSSFLLVQKNTNPPISHLSRLGIPPYPFPPKWSLFRVGGRAGPSAICCIKCALLEDCTKVVKYFFESSTAHFSQSIARF